MSENFSQEINENKAQIKINPCVTTLFGLSQSELKLNEINSNLNENDLIIKIPKFSDIFESQEQEIPQNKTEIINPFQKMFKKLLEIEIKPETALFLIFYYNIKNENEIFEYLSTDRFNKYIHPYCVSKQTVNQYKCSICGERKEEHYSLDSEDEKRAKLIYDSVEACNFEQINNSIDPNFLNLQLTTCTICYNFIPEGLMFTLNDNISHEICILCMKTYLKNEITNNKVMNLRCPHCEHQFKKPELEQILDAETIKKYDTFVLNNQVLSDPLLRFCPKCSSIVTLDQENAVKGTCKQCGQEICPKCNHEFHDGVSCLNAIDKDLLIYRKKKDTRRCPKCKVLVEKAEGCNHMTCFVCQYEFCWICGGIYTSYHFLPVNPLGCPGLQFARTKNSKFNCVKRNFIRVLSWLLCLFLFPFYVIFFMPVYFCAVVFQSRFYRLKIRRTSCRRISFIIFLIILCIVLEPVFLAIEIIGVIPFIIVAARDYYKERARRIQKVRKVFNSEILP